jgi:lipoprotein-releasing system permease protein
MLFLAIKHLFTRKKQSIITLLGIMIGTTAFIVMSAFFAGVQNQITDSLVSGDAHIKIYAQEEDITPDSIEKKQFNNLKLNKDANEKHEIKSITWIRKPGGTRKSLSIENPNLWREVFKDSEEFLAYSPAYSTSVFTSLNNQSWTINLAGVEPSQYINITNIETKMTQGSLLDLEKGTGRVIIGEELAKALGKELFDNIIVTSTAGKQYPLKIVGLYNTSNRRADLSSGLVTLTDAQKIGQALGKISQIHVKVKNFRTAADTSNQWKKISNDLVESWDQAHEGLISMFQSQDMTRYMATGIIMLVAAFGIYNILNMIVNQKRKDIAILRSMGFEAKDIINLFLFQGVALGFSGGVAGMMLGYGICKAIGRVEFGPPGSRGDGFTLDFDFKIYMTAFLISSTAAIIASILPSRSAAKLTPIEIIRSGAE